MKSQRAKRWQRVLGASGLLSVLAIAPVLAQSANFGSITLSGSAPTATTDGYTAGFFALTDIAARDKSGNICTGFADTNPDHLMVLERDFASLSVQVNSGGNDTTLLIQGPNDNTIRCGEDTDRRNPDALVSDTNWPAGTYRIWVGAQSQGSRYNYTLTAQE